MKKVMALVLAVVMAVSMMGCGGSDTKEVLLDYINYDLELIGLYEEELLASYGSVTGDNYTSDADMYVEFVSTTADLAKGLYDEAVDISREIDDDKVLEVHRIYIKYSNKFMNLINLMITALEEQDMDKAMQANEDLNEVNNLALDFQTELLELAEEYDVEIY